MRLGEVLLGKSFGAINADGKSPEYAGHLDNVHISWALHGLFPQLCKVLERIPIRSLQQTIIAGNYVYDVRYMKV